MALCLQFDYHLHKKRAGKKLITKGGARFIFPAPYFTACFSAYFAGLFTTMFIMHVFKAAQPALLYLSPACSLAPLIVAYLRNELSEMFAFRPQEEAQQAADGSNKAKVEDNAAEEEDKGFSTAVSARKTRARKSKN